MEDVLNKAHQASRMDMRLLRLLGEEGGATIDWLGHGVNIQAVRLPHPPWVKRMHVLVPKAAEWPKVLRPILQRKGVEVLTETKGVRLYQNTAGRVVGVQAVDLNTNRTTIISARRAVMLTAGNLEAQPGLDGEVHHTEIAAMLPAVISRDGSGLVMAGDWRSIDDVVDCISTLQVRGAPPDPACSLSKQV